MSATLAICMSLFVAQGLPPDAGTGPEPSPTPMSWELDIRFVDPQRIEVQLPGERRSRVYWYMLYTVVNRGQSAQRWHPTFEIVTDNFNVIQADVGVSPLVYEAIAARHKLTHPYLRTPVEAIGTLRVGEDNAVESVAVWPRLDPGVESFRVYVEGLSGETRYVPNPALPQDAAAAEKPDFFTLRKTLEIRYTLPGSPRARAIAEPARVGVRWVLR
jgi:hypothetical protein